MDSGHRERQDQQRATCANAGGSRWEKAGDQSREATEASAHTAVRRLADSIEINLAAAAGVKTSCTPRAPI